jgi:hypothetical protein
MLKAHACQGRRNPLIMAQVDLACNGGRWSMSLEDKASAPQDGTAPSY